MEKGRIKIRNCSPSDHEKVISVMPSWWGGRDLTSVALKVFFIHFGNTTYIAELKDDLVGFLVGFLSQAHQDVGYIHLVGVHPDHRKAGIARLLYERFYDACRGNNRYTVRSCTSPINRLSIEFHRRMGFVIEPGDGIVDGIPVTMNFLGNNCPKVLFEKRLSGTPIRISRKEPKCSPANQLLTKKS